MRGRKRPRRENKHETPVVLFERSWRYLGGPILCVEHRFHPTRRWRFDYSRGDVGLAIEIEGGTWIQGAHSTGRGMTEDATKYNQAALLGWFVYRLTQDMLERDPVGHLTPIIEKIKRRQE